MDRWFQKSIKAPTRSARSAGQRPPNWPPVKWPVRFFQSARPWRAGSFF